MDRFQTNIYQIVHNLFQPNSYWIPFLWLMFIFLIAAWINTTIYDTNIKHMKSTKTAEILPVSQDMRKNQTIIYR